MAGAARAETTTEEKKEPGLSVEDIRGGSLMRFGFSLGVAGVAHLPNSEVQAVWATGTMAYAAVFPGTLFIKGPETRSYCAARWGAQTPEDRQSIADEAARRRAKQILDKKTVTDAEVFDATHWFVGVPASNWACALQVPGLYVGIPASFKADATRADATVAFSDFEPLVSFGFILAPTSYFAVLGGATASRFAEEERPSQISWSWTLGVGASTDLFDFFK